MAKLKGRGIKKAHFHTKKDTLQRLEADLHVTQALQSTINSLKMATLLKYSPFTTAPVSSKDISFWHPVCKLRKVTYRCLLETNASKKSYLCITFLFFASLKDERFKYNELIENVIISKLKD
jgi:hypothetical protein